MTGRKMARAWCVRLALVTLMTSAAAFTVDCDKDYVDCEKELSKLTDEFDVTTVSAVNAEPLKELQKNSTNIPKVSEVTQKINSSAKGRFLNHGVEDLQLENVLNQTTHAKKSIDLSDVSLDDEDFEISPHKVNNDDARIVNKKPILSESDDSLKLDTRESSNRAFQETNDKCTENDISYKVGEKMNRGCEESCQCAAGKWRCQARCQLPYVRRGRRVSDPLCYENPVDDCCSIITCSNAVDPELKTSGGAAKVEEKKCRSGNSSYALGERWDEGCERRCVCEASFVVNCTPRCAVLPSSEHCINVQDPHDVCCQVQVCDVTHDGHEHDDSPVSQTTIEDRMDTDFDDLLLSTTSKLPTAKQTIEPIKGITVLTNNTILLDLAFKNNTEKPFHLQISRNGGFTLDDITLSNSIMISNLESGIDYILKVKETGKTFDFKIPAFEFKNEVRNDEKEDEKTTEKHENMTSISTEMQGCISEGVMYRIGEEFRIGCSELCECVGPGQKECASLDCPSHVGLELISPTCIRWAPDPPDWTPVPPACCPSKMRCLSDGNCNYKGHKIPNWSEVPESLTGCELRCFCESGMLDCQNICSPLPPLPPQTLRCQPSYKPGAVNISDDDCCKQWGCVPIGSPSASRNPPAFLPTLPPTVPNLPFPSGDGFDEDDNDNKIRPPKIPTQYTTPAIDHIDNSKLNLRTLVSDTPTSMKIVFELSPVFVGLRGSVDLRYTDKDDDDISNWESQIFAPTDEILTTPRLEFRLTGLRPSTVYRLRGKLYIHNLPLEPVSSVYSVKTLDEPLLEEKRRVVEAGLRVQNVNATAAQLSWRHFTEDQLQYIDGIQVRYRPLEQPIYSMTELLHHWRVSVELVDLRPGSQYEASLVLVSPPRSPVELYDPRVVNFTTPHYYDMYNFSVTVEARRVGSEAVEVTWRGVPAPPERYVRVYRAAHSCDGNMATAPANRERDAFKLADRDQPPIIQLNGLRSDSKCRVWLELFLTNGKVKISNVLDITTKQEDAGSTLDNEVQATSVTGSRSGSGDYYSALVGVGVVAALGTLASLLLLLVVMRRHRPHSVTISTDL